MKRSPSESEAKRAGRSGSSSSQRLAAAGVQTIEAHTRVRKFAERLGEELEKLEELEEGIMRLNEGSSAGLGPEDPMVVAVEKAASAMRSVTASMVAVAAVPESSTTFATGMGERTPSTKLGVAPPPRPDKAVVKTKRGIAPPSKRAPDADGE